MGIIVVKILLGYLIGSIPTAVWYGKVFYNIDVRNLGSGNAGATNSLRVLGKKAGAIVFLIDFLKGLIAYKLSEVIMPEASSLIDYPLGFFMGFAAIIGHIFPIYAGFRGGKGVATALGVISAAFPMAALISFLVFVIVVYLTRYVSLGSMLGAVAFPLQFVFKIWETDLQNEYLIFGSIVSLILILTHRQNIKKLLNGTENKFGAKKSN